MRLPHRCSPPPQMPAECINNASGHSRLLPASASCPHCKPRCAPHSLQNNATAGSPPNQQPSLGHPKLSGPSQVPGTGYRAGTCPAACPTSLATRLFQAWKSPRAPLGKPACPSDQPLDAIHAAGVTEHLTRCLPPQPAPSPKCSPRGSAMPPTLHHTPLTLNCPRPQGTQVTTPPGHPVHSAGRHQSQKNSLGVCSPQHENPGPSAA